MLWFAFVRGLLKFKADEPAFDVLFQFAPTIGKRNGSFPGGILSRFASVFLRLNPSAEKPPDLVHHVRH